MIYMLDTNICIYIINQHPTNYYQKLDLLEKTNDLVISSIVLAELQYGVANSKHKEQNQIKVNTLISKLEILDFSAKCAVYYGELRAELKQKGTIIGNNDLLIASHALCQQAILVTNNCSEFQQVPNLIIENWGYNAI
ncbi:type II toxin-antitoxin system tRNA(fMet)-specific endonuclease VapC [Candidatus Tisiphia endosymbiont of Oplodontha viridula]|uniref:type II toxin-antitoxin system tRNA(fMet)-specific endonuclease VapC n=1 Tax=Candidatus Tisiphia endosymbiont of Oplodontha viridula TaxID=3077925 RepID=UPI0035C88CBA